MSALRVALGEYDVGWEDPAGSLARAEALVARAAAAGARLVALPEMCATGFTMDSARWAEPLDGASGRRLGEIAARHGVWLVAGLTARDEEGAFNAAALYSPAGELAGAYRKQRLFAYGGEHASYAPGSAPFVFEVEGVRLAAFVCYDLRFPELFRAVARDVDAMVLIANWPAARRAHWDALVRARAIENLSYFVAVNRTGTGGRLEYDGGSVAYDPWGELAASSAQAGEGVALVDVDPGRVAEIRARYPFLEDLQPASLASLA